MLTVKRMLTAKQLLDKEYLETRCALIEIAAAMDRYDRAADGDDDEEDADERLQQIYQALDLLASPQAVPNRSEQLLRLFSEDDSP